MLMRKNKNKKTNKLLNDYPCSDYLHDALRFLREGNVDAAYDEICWAITKSGGELTEEEHHPVIRGNGFKSVLCVFDEEDKVYLTVCPNCKGGPINFLSDECEFCGQKLDWSEVIP